MIDDDFVVDIKQATSQTREAQLVTVNLAATTQASATTDAMVAEVSTTVDPNDSHESVTSSHDAHDTAHADTHDSHHDDSTTDDSATADDTTSEATVTDEPAHVEAV